MMQTQIQKVTLEASELSGGPRAMFRGHDAVSARYSEPRLCIRLHRNIVRGVFRWPHPAAAMHAVLRIRGMWDMLKEMPLTFANSVDLKTWGQFEVRVNGRCIFNATVQFMNYRSWRFWPAIEIDIPPDMLRKGRNTLAIVNHTRPFKRLPSAHMPIPRSILANTAYQVSDVQVLAFERRPLLPPAAMPAGTWLGHLVGGHEGVHLSDEDFSRTARLFSMEAQGNLLAFLFNSHFCEIDPALIDVDLIKQAGLSVAIRNHFNYDGAQGHALPEAEYNRRLRIFIRRLGKHFIGFAPHEQHGQMAAIVNQAGSTDLAAITSKFAGRFKTLMQKIRAIAPGAAVWETDPSFYHRYYLAAGAAFPAIELCGAYASLTAASARGTAKAFGLDRWGAINAWECQCYGGLGTRSQDARLDQDFDRKRLDLWWLTQYMLYLGGARTIYSESGAFYHRLTREREWDDPAVAGVRAVQRGLVAFARRHALQGQPSADIAYLQGKYDIANAWIDPAIFKVAGFSPYSWRQMEACYPDFVLNPYSENEANFQRRGACREDTIAHTPFGQADILPVEAPADAMTSYRMLIMSGWNTLAPESLAKLMGYVRKGGVLTMLLPQLTAATRTENPCAAIPARWLRDLCGLAFAGKEADADAPIHRLAVPPSARRRFQETCRLIRRQPAEPFYARRSAYEAMLCNMQAAGRNVSVLIKETFSGFPFLTEHRLGKGRVYLFNLADYPLFPTIYEVIKAVLRDLIMELPRDVQLLAGSKINYFVYPGPVRSGIRRRIYVISTDWHSRKRSSAAVFGVCGKTISIPVLRNRVSIVTAKGQGRHTTVSVAVENEQLDQNRSGAN